MRTFAGCIAVLTVLAPFAPAADKLTLDDKIELTRGLSFEYANAKTLLPRSKKPLEFDSKGTFDKQAWSLIAKESGPAARTGDTVQVTKVDLGDDRITLQINGGFKGAGHWYDKVQVGGGMGGGGGTVPINPNANSDAPGGTTIVIIFHKSMAAMKASEVKKMLAPILDFDRHSVTEIYSETLPPEVQAAIKEKRALVGMDKEQVRMAMGRPETSPVRETKDGMDLEDWIYGKAPGKITFVTFNGDKVIKVQEYYTGLGTQVDPTKK